MDCGFSVDWRLRGEGWSLRLLLRRQKRKNTKAASPRTATGTPTAGPMMDPIGFELEAVSGDGVGVAGIGTTISLD